MGQCMHLYIYQCIGCACCGCGGNDRALERACVLVGVHHNTRHLVSNKASETWRSCAMHHYPSIHVSLALVVLTSSTLHLLLNLVPLPSICTSRRTPSQPPTFRSRRADQRSPANLNASSPRPTSSRARSRPDCCPSLPTCTSARGRGRSLASSTASAPTDASFHSTHHTRPS